MNNRIQWLDAIKGLGIFMIMLSHLSCFPVLSPYLYCGYIPLFYIASGYTLRFSDYKTFLYKKAKRMLIPYFFYGMLTTVFFFFISRHIIAYQGGEVHEWIGLLYSRYCLFPYGEPHNIYFLPIEASSPLWFLTSLFSGFLAYYFIYKSSNKLLIVTAYILLSWVLQYLGVLLPWSVDVAFLVAIFLWFGNVMRNSHIFDVLIRHRIVVLVFALLGYVVIVYVNGGVNLSVRQYGDCGSWAIFLFVISSILYFIIATCVFLSENFFQKIFAWLGSISMQLMCIQMPVFFVVKKVGARICLDDSITCICALFSAILLAFLIKTTSHRYTDKMALLRYL